MTKLRLTSGPRLMLDRFSSKPGLYVIWREEGDARTTKQLGLSIHTVKFGRIRLLPLPFKPIRIIEVEDDCEQ